MTSPTAAGTSAFRLAALHLRRDKDADFTISCQGNNIAAHSFLLASTSEYFEIALSKDWMEKKEKKMEIKDCSVEALKVVVNFMYGINIPEDFDEHGELLHLAELFMMANLKEVVVEKLAKALSKSNYLEISQIAELYNTSSLINKCAHFVFEEMSDCDEINWEDMGKLSKVITAFGKRAIKGKGISVANEVAYVKKRDDFDSDELYGEFVGQNVVKGSVVCLREDCGEGLNMGDLGTVVSQKPCPGFGPLLKLIFSGREVGLFSHRVEIHTRMPQFKAQK